MSGRYARPASPRITSYNVCYTKLLRMIITDVDTVNIIKPKRKELFETGNIFSEYINYSPDTYWQNTNIIEPEKEIMRNNFV